MPENILEIALTSYCNTIGQLIEQCLLHIRIFFGVKRNSPCFDLFHPLADKTLIVIETIFSFYLALEMALYQIILKIKVP